MNAPTNSVLDQVLGDLQAESDALEAMVAPLDETGWRTPTPAAGWDVATQVAHLAWTDEVAVAAATDKEVWDAFVLKAIADPTGYVDVEALEGGKAAPPTCSRAGSRRGKTSTQRCGTTPRGRRCRGSALR